MKHKHADLMLEYAKQAQVCEEPWRNWERTYPCSDGTHWEDLQGTPSWNKKIEYRMKKKTINIGGVEINEPVRGALTIGEIYYIPYLGSSSRASYHICQGDDLDYLRISSGIVHRNEDDAIKHAIALMGLTC